MQKSESIDLLASALSKAQAEIKGAIKDSTNPFFKSSYADLSSVWEAIRMPFTKNGLSVSQIPYEVDKGTLLETIIMHSSGQWIMGELLINPVKNDPQSKGSAMSYARRYSLASMAGVAQIDDDAEAAQGRDVKQEKKSEHVHSLTKIETDAPVTKSNPSLLSEEVQALITALENGKTPSDLWKNSPVRAMKVAKEVQKISVEKKMSFPDVVTEFIIHGIRNNYIKG